MSSRSEAEKKKEKAVPFRSSQYFQLWKCNTLEAARGVERGGPYLVQYADLFRCRILQSTKQFQRLLLPNLHWGLLSSMLTVAKWENYPQKVARQGFPALPPTVFSYSGCIYLLSHLNIKRGISSSHLLLQSLTSAPPQ